MRVDQQARYARHVQLPAFGEAAQSAILEATAQLAIEPDPGAALIAAEFLVAAGVGTLRVIGATAEQRAQIAMHAAEPCVVDATGSPTARSVELAARPAWWPTAAGDEVALAYWRGGLAATTWLVAAAAANTR